MLRDKLVVWMAQARASEANMTIPANVQRRGEGDKAQVGFSGTVLVAEPEDFESLEAMTALNDAIIADLGEITRGSERTGSEPGQKKDLVYVLNNGGLRLNYNDHVLDQYRPQGGGGRGWSAALTWAAADASRIGMIVRFSQAPEGTSEKAEAKKALLEAFEASKSS